MKSDEPGCDRPSGKVVGAEKEAPVIESKEQEKPKMTVQVGKKAPDFEAPSYHKGKFGSFKLSNHLGHWVLLCFYPGDFTFV